MNVSVTLNKVLHANITHTKQEEDKEEMILIYDVIITRKAVSDLILKQSICIHKDESLSIGYFACFEAYFFCKQQICFITLYKN